MKITKIAGGIPAGFIEIEYTITEKDQRIDVTGHGPGTSCKTQDDAQLLQDLLDAEIGDFGGGGGADSGGKTAEGFAEEAAGKPKAKGRFNLDKEKREFGNMPPAQDEDKTRQYDAGMV